ncbi:hypothetical protein Rhopal_003636-T1 [Rhodotorula paludigena]|uniref:DUF7719 domain-containing protein n=1 Tax=Rhodotorula paludigena TaxID=86838 RepID=A0AAV5GJL1_9BASI|nr:hypothetical protein Rhopal_003636-T1 [Rhodotorula paludigena]
MPPKQRPAAVQGSWTPSPSPPASPSLLDLSHEDRLRLLETHGPMKPSELGLPNGLARKGKGAGQGKGKEPMVVLRPDELEQLVAQQQATGKVHEIINGGGAEGDENAVYAEEGVPLWEEVLNTVLWTVPFAFLYAGMDYAVHAQFGQELVLRDELRRLVNFVPALLLLNFLTLRPPSRAPLPPLATQVLLAALCVSTGLSTIHTCTTQSYLRVMARAPATGVLWCWTVVRLELPWAVAALVGVGAGVWVQGNTAWLRGLV